MINESQSQKLSGSRESNNIVSVEVRQSMQEVNQQLGEIEDSKYCRSQEQRRVKFQHNTNSL